MLKFDHNGVTYRLFLRHRRTVPTDYERHAACRLSLAHAKGHWGFYCVQHACFVRERRRSDYDSLGTIALLQRAYPETDTGWQLVATGWSQQSPRDQFNRKVGRAVAVGRLRAALAETHPDLASAVALFATPSGRKRQRPTAGTAPVPPVSGATPA